MGSRSTKFNVRNSCYVRFIALAYKIVPLLLKGEALLLHQNALEIWLEQLGERHPDIATSYSGLAWGYATKREIYCHSYPQT